MNQDRPESEETSASSTWLARLVKIEPGELRAVKWSVAYYFFLLSGYYVLRPLRETLGIKRGTEVLSTLFLCTFISMLVAVPIYSALVSRFERRVFVPIVYQFFALNILGFFGAMYAVPEAGQVKVGYVFFVWLSVFNLFAVSVFWSFMADLYRESQGRRLFGFIAGGGSLGALAGSGITSALATRIPENGLFLVAFVLLQGAVVCVWRLGSIARSELGSSRPIVSTESGPTGGGVFTGFVTAVKNPYLLGICGYLFFATFCGTFVYMFQAQVVTEAFPDSEDPARLKLFSDMNFWTQALSLIFQTLLAARILAWMGVGMTLCTLPVIYILGFGVLGTSSVLWVLVGFQVLRRSLNYGLAKPTKEYLFTSVDREDKYKAKSFIDTVVYRGGDAISARLHARIDGNSIQQIAYYLLIPVAIAWIGLALFLGKQQVRRSATRASSGEA